ncbi:MAG: undecaprenyl-diphosphate phosphatase [Candidatus Acidiferrales bacterium]|jgi:undecaprenyl-diphosphatase
MSLLHVIILAVVQGLTELLPVSSSAHVVVAEKLMGMDPSSPAMTLLLIMLHTGTMFAVIVYFWKQWRDTYFASVESFLQSAWLVILATTITGFIGGGLVKLIEHVTHADVEQLFDHLELIAPALAAVGVLILIAGSVEKRLPRADSSDGIGLNGGKAALIGAVQGFTLPFRGFSRSGATISTGMLAGVAKARAETFSFALAVLVTPPVIAREALRLLKAEHAAGGVTLGATMLPICVGSVCAFLAGLLALKWLSKWLEGGRWYLFGIYCLIAAAAVMWLHHAGF